MCKPDCENSVAPLSIEFRCAFAKAPRSVLNVASVSLGIGSSSPLVFALVLVLENNELLLKEG